MLEIKSMFKQKKFTKMLSQGGSIYKTRNLKTDNSPYVLYMQNLSISVKRFYFDAITEKKGSSYETIFFAKRS